MPELAPLCIRASIAFNSLVLPEFWVRRGFPVLPRLTLSVGFDTLIVFSECTISVESLSPVIFTVAGLGPSYMIYIINAFRRARTEPEQAVPCSLPL